MYGLFGRQPRMLRSNYEGSFPDLNYNGEEIHSSSSRSSSAHRHRPQQSQQSSATPPSIKDKNNHNKKKKLPGNYNYNKTQPNPKKNWISALHQKLNCANPVCRSQRSLNEPDALDNDSELCFSPLASNYPIRKVDDDDDDDCYNCGNSKPGTSPCVSETETSGMESHSPGPTPPRSSCGDSSSNNSGVPPIQASAPIEASDSGIDQPIIPHRHNNNMQDPHDLDDPGSPPRWQPPTSEEDGPSAYQPHVALMPEFSVDDTQVFCANQTNSMQFYQHPQQQDQQQQQQGDLQVPSQDAVHERQLVCWNQEEETYLGDYYQADNVEYDDDYAEKLCLHTRFSEISKPQHQYSTEPAELQQQQQQQQQQQDVNISNPQWSTERDCEMQRIPAPCNREMVQRHDILTSDSWRDEESSSCYYDSGVMDQPPPPHRIDEHREESEATVWLTNSSRCERVHDLCIPSGASEDPDIYLPEAGPNVSIDSYELWVKENEFEKAIRSSELNERISHFERLIEAAEYRAPLERQRENNRMATIEQQGHYEQQQQQQPALVTPPPRGLFWRSHPMQILTTTDSDVHLIDTSLSGDSTYQCDDSNNDTGDLVRRSCVTFQREPPPMPERYMPPQRELPPPMPDRYMPPQRELPPPSPKRNVPPQRELPPPSPKRNVALQRQWPPPAKQFQRVDRLVHTVDSGDSRPPVPRRFLPEV